MNIEANFEEKLCSCGATYATASFSCFMNNPNCNCDVSTCECECSPRCNCGPLGDLCCTVRTKAVN